MSLKDFSNYSVIAAIIGIVALEIVALCNGINGVVLGAALAILGGLGGYQVSKRVQKH